MSRSRTKVGDQPAQEDGLFLRGHIVRRTKRTITRRDNTQVEVVRFHIAAGERVEPYEVWDPKHLFAVGEAVSLPVTVRPYRSAHGVGYCLGPPVSGEEF